MTANFMPREEGGSAIGCDSCHCEVPLVETAWPYGQRRSPEDRPHRLLCRFCYETMAGTYTAYPSPDVFVSLRAETWMAAAAVYNMLAEKKNG